MYEIGNRSLFFITVVMGFFGTILVYQAEGLLSSAELGELFGVSAATGAGKAKEVRRILKTRQMDPEWTLPSLMGQNIMAWLVSIDGILVDARRLPLPYQMALAEAGFIPYVPDPGEGEE